MKKTAKYYKDNPDAKKRKNKYQKEYNKSPKEKKRRAELNKYNRDAQKAGRASKGDGLDASHNGNKIVGFERQSTNRGSRSNSIGDKSARGGKKKK